MPAPLARKVMNIVTAGVWHLKGSFFSVEVQKKSDEDSRMCALLVGILN